MHTDHDSDRRTHMKKNKFGMKIQNWHRPLGSSQLGRRFLRHRYDDPELAKPGKYGDFLEDLNDYTEYEESDETAMERFLGYELRWYGLEQVLTEVVKRPPPLFCREWAIDHKVDGTSE